MTDIITKNALVKFSNPEDEHEKKLVFHVIEDRGNRVLVEALVSNMMILPTFVYNKTDLVSVD